MKQRVVKAVSAVANWFLSTHSSITQVFECSKWGEAQVVTESRESVPYPVKED
jgi:hypothetical protein